MIRRLSCRTRNFAPTSMCNTCGSTPTEIRTTTTWRRSDSIFQTVDDAKPSLRKRKPTASRPNGCSKENSSVGSPRCKHQFVVAETSAEQLKIYKEGLIPQSEATLRSAQAAYQSGKQDFETLLNSFLDVLGLQIEYQRELADHESALAELERLRGWICR